MSHMRAVELNNRFNFSAEKLSATRTWLEDHANEAEVPHDNWDDSESLVESSVVFSSDEDDDDDDESNAETDYGEASVTTKPLGTQTASSSIDLCSIKESIQQIVNPTNSVQTVGNVSISNSTNVHIGNVTNINGNITIIQRQKEKARKPLHGKEHNDLNSKNSPGFGAKERQERANPDAFIKQIKFKIPKHLHSVVPRSMWLAQMPMEDYDYIVEPVEYVVISHTATESSEKQAINIRTIRHIQCFHIESYGWDDIAYNFLIGNDGNVYEGRSWGVVGAHTKGYNTCAIGISFVGCFMRILPTEAALNACKNLLKRGVADGHLSPNYKLICHCQCRPTESPGRKLFEDIQKWDHFHNIEDHDEDVDGDHDDEVVV